MLGAMDDFTAYGGLPALLTEGPYKTVSLASLPNRSRVGGPSLRLSGASGGVSVSHGGQIIGVAFAYRIEQLPTASVSMALAQFVAYQPVPAPPAIPTGTSPRALATLAILPTGQIEWRGFGIGGPRLEASLPVIMPSAYHFIDINAIFGPNGNSVVVSVDGVTALTAAFVYPDDDRPANPTPADTWVAGGRDVPGSSAVLGVDICDLCLSAGSAEMLEDRRVISRPLEADGPVQEWITSVDLAAWQILNNKPPVDSVGNISASEMDQTAQIDPAEFPDFSEIDGIYILTRAWSNVAIEDGLSVSVQSGAGSAEALYDLSDRPRFYGAVFEVDPALGSPWVPSALNAIQVSLQRTFE